MGKEIQFYDRETHRYFTTGEYKKKTVDGRKFAVAIAPSGTEARVLMYSKVKRKRRR